MMAMRSFTTCSVLRNASCFSGRQQTFAEAISVRARQECTRAVSRNSRRSCLQVRAIEVSGPQGSPSSSGTPPVSPVVQQQISGELMQSMKEKIRDALSAELVEVTDTYGDGRHVSIDVVAKVFEGESTMKRQRMVYKAIWEELQNAVHAVDAMTTKTPSEAGL